MVEQGLKKVPQSARLSAGPLGGLIAIWPITRVRISVMHSIQPHGIDPIVPYLGNVLIILGGASLIAAS